MKNENLQCQPQPGQIRLDRLVKKSHPIARVADLIDWDAIERDIEQYFPSDSDHPGIPLRLAVGLLLLKCTYDHSDDEVLDLFSRDPYYQYFCGGEVYVRNAPISQSMLSNWIEQLGEEGAQILVKATAELVKRMEMDDDEAAKWP